MEWRNLRVPQGRILSFQFLDISEQLVLAFDFLVQSRSQIFVFVGEARAFPLAALEVVLPLEVAGRHVVARVLVSGAIRGSVFLFREVVDAFGGIEIAETGCDFLVDVADLFYGLPVHAPFG